MSRGRTALLHVAVAAVTALGLTNFELNIAHPAMAAEAVDLELVIATDVSRSIDVSEARLQREGVAAALRTPAVIDAIRGGYHKKIAVAYIDYSNASETFIVVDWRIIDSQQSAEAFAEILTEADLNFGRRTSISEGIEFAARMIEENAYEGLRRVIDVSGDGPNNHGRLVAEVRNETIAKRITINGLPIVDRGVGFASQFALDDLDKYYRGCVIGGPNAFMVVARDFPDFARAIRRKLIFELAGISPRQAPDAATALLHKVADTPNPTGYVYERGCDIGERIWQQRWGGGYSPDINR